jgi:tetratricopeptide (TPR) repeat protein
MSTPVPQPGPDIIDLVQSCAPSLSGNDLEHLRRAFEPPPGVSDEPTPEQLEAVYTTATRLCDEGNFRFAAGLALHLTTYKPNEPRFSFMAGTCMQRLGVPSNAARYFCLALINGGDNPAALYRLGECLLALGDNVNAERALEAALDVSREVEGVRELQDMTQSLMASMKGGAR